MDQGGGGRESRRKKMGKLLDFLFFFATVAVTQLRGELNHALQAKPHLFLPFKCIKKKKRKKVYQPFFDKVGKCVHVYVYACVCMNFFFDSPKKNSHGIRLVSGWMAHYYNFVSCYIFTFFLQGSHQTPQRSSFDSIDHKRKKIKL